MNVTEDGPRATDHVVCAGAGLTQTLHRITTRRLFFINVADDGKHT